MLVVGALGRMGERVRAVLEDDAELRLGAALEAPGHPGQGSRVQDGVVVGDDREAALAACDVAIVFATPQASLPLLRDAAKSGIPCVVGTTGFSDEEQAELEDLARAMPLLVASNFSVAVNVLFHLARRAAALLGSDFDAEIVELHHGAKLDAPSGTALSLARAVAEGRGERLEERMVLARQGQTGPRPTGAIGIQTLRGGDNPGEHQLWLVGRGERLELAHRSATRDHFAAGAVRAAAWLLDREPGRYEMAEVLGLAE